MGWSQALEQQQTELRNVEPVLQRIADEVILGPAGALARNYAASGLKQRSGFAFNQITQRGFRDNYVRVSGNTVTVGVDIWKPGGYIRYLLLGHGVIRPKYVKALHWINQAGQDVFARKVKAMPARRVYYLTSDDIGKAQAVAARMFGFGMRA